MSGIALPMLDAPTAPSEPSATAAAPTVLRTLLGMRLRRLREASGVSAAAAAQAIRGSESKISRIELGRNSVRGIDVADLLTLYGVTDPAQRDELLGLAARTGQQGWWHRYQDVLPGWFEPYLGLEESAAGLSSYDAQFVPGLLQTPDYSRAIIGLGCHPAAVTERMVRLRIERQLRAAACGLRLHAVIDEVALRRPAAPAAVMRGQLEYLLAQCGKPGCTIAVTPFNTGASYAAPASFSILRFAERDLPDVVYVEQLASAMYLDKPADVDRYARAMDQIVATSTTPGRTADLIRSILAEVEEDSGEQYSRPR